MNISNEQLKDAVEKYGDSAKFEGVAFEKTSQSLTTPTFDMIKQTLKVEGLGTTLTYRGVEALALAKVPKARVMVGIKTKTGAAYLPGIVLPDSTPGEVRFGCLNAPEDVRQATTSEATKALTGYQQILLAKIAAEHQPKVGEHATGGRINAADIGHAVVAAATSNPVGIHATVHNLVDTKSLSANIANSGVTDMQIGDRLRKNSEMILNQNQVAGVIIVDSHQLHFPITDDFEVSAGFTLAAQQSRGQAPDLSRNLASMVA